MRKTILFLTLTLLAPSLLADGRHRIVGLPTAPPVVLTGQVTDASDGSPVVQVEVSAPGRFERTDSEGKFTMKLQVNVPTTVTLTRTGYQPLTQTITLAAAQNATFQMQPLPTARLTTTTGTTYVVDADTVEFGYSIPFSGLRRDRQARMCRPGVPQFTLDRSEIQRIIGPAVTTNDATCCTRGPVTGATFRLKNGEETTAYFVDSCEHPHMQIFARDHKTWDLVFVEFSQLTEAVLP